MITKALKSAAFVGIAMIGVLLLHLAALQLAGNFHVVAPDEAYRSAQPSAADIAAYSERYGIRTVVNLCGASRAPWYADEKRATAKLGIRLIDFPLSAATDVTPAQISSLAGLLKTADKPILIHCKSGADRTGLASVIYLGEVAGADEATAERQLSIWYGHVSLFGWSPTAAMERSWEREEAALGLDS